MADSAVEGSEGGETFQPSQQVISEEKNTSKGPDDVAVITSEATTGEAVTEDKVSTGQTDVLSLKECCRDAFRKMTEYLDGELAASLEDYVLLEKLNKLAVTKYGEMSNTAKTLITAMEELDKKYKSLEPYLEQIDKVEESVASLEQAAYRLDAYSKRLEAKFKKLERR